MLVPAFRFTCPHCQGETNIRLGEIVPGSEFSCVRCGRPLEITEAHRQSIKQQMEELMHAMPDHAEILH